MTTQSAFKPGTHVTFFLWTICDDEHNWPVEEFIATHMGTVKEYDWDNDAYLIVNDAGDELWIGAVYLSLTKLTTVTLIDRPNAAAFKQHQPVYRVPRPTHSAMPVAYWTLCTFITFAIIYILWSAFYA